MNKDQRLLAEAYEQVQETTLGMSKAQLSQSWLETVKDTDKDNLGYDGQNYILKPSSKGKGQFYKSYIGGSLTFDEDKRPISREEKIKEGYYWSGLGGRYKAVVVDGKLKAMPYYGDLYVNYPNWRDYVGDEEGNPIGGRTYISAMWPPSEENTKYWEEWEAFRSRDRANDGKEETEDPLWKRFHSTK